MSVFNGSARIWCEGEVSEGRWIWGWDCTCGEEESGFGNATTAAEARDNHVAFCDRSAP